MQLRRKAGPARGHAPSRRFSRRDSSANRDADDVSTACHSHAESQDDNTIELNLA